MVGIPIGSLNTMEVLNSMALIDSFVSYNEFVLANNMLKDYSDMKKEIKSLDFCNSSKILIYLWKNVTLFEVLKKYRKSKPKSPNDKKTRIMLLSKCSVCDSKNSRFIKN